MELALAGRSIAACIVVALVLVAVAAFSRVVMRGRASARPGGRLLAVLETAMLPGAASLHVVRVADRYYAIGRSGAHIATLAEIPPERALPSRGTGAEGSDPAGTLATLVARLRELGG